MKLSVPKDAVESGTSLRGHSWRVTSLTRGISSRHLCLEGRAPNFNILKVRSCEFCIFITDTLGMTNPNQNRS
jgi:hypothetical protein